MKHNPTYPYSSVSLQNADTYRQEQAFDPSASAAATLAATQSILMDEEGSDSKNADAVKFLEAHGISYLPEDNDTPLETFMSSGGQHLALTEAGKMALSESSQGRAKNVSQVPRTPTLVIKSNGGQPQVSWSKHYLVAQLQ